MKLNMPDALYMISEPEAAAAPAELSASQTASQAMVPRERSWRDLMQRMEKKKQQDLPGERGRRWAPAQPLTRDVPGKVSLQRG